MAKNIATSKLSYPAFKSLYFPGRPRSVAAPTLTHLSRVPMPTLRIAYGNDSFLLYNNFVGKGRGFFGKLSLHSTFAATDRGRATRNASVTFPRI